MKGRRIERGILAGLTLASLVWTLVWLVGIARTPGFQPLVDRAGSELAAVYERALARAATPEVLGARLEARLDESPRDWVVIEGLVDLAAAQGVALPEALRERIAALDAVDNGWIAAATSCAACALDVAACDLSVGLACGVAMNLTVLGDLVALGREGGRYLAGEAVDSVDVGIAFVGLAATGLVVASGGTSLVVKGGAAVLRIAHRTGRLAPEVVAVFRGALGGIDWARLRVAQPELVRPAVVLAQDMGRLQEAVGMRQALHLVGRLDTPAEIARAGRAAEALGPRTLGAFEVLGTSRVLRLGVRMADEVWAVLAGVLGLIASGAGLLAPLLARGAKPLLRLALRAVAR